MPRVYRLNLKSGLLELAVDPDVSGKQNAWLTELECQFPDLRYAIKNGECRIGPRKLKVDGFTLSSNTAFEFDGCYYHECLCVKPSRTKTNEEIVAFKKLMAEDVKTL